MQEKDTKQHFITKRKSADHVIKYCIDNSAKTRVSIQLWF